MPHDVKCNISAEGPNTGSEARGGGGKGKRGTEEEPSGDVSSCINNVFNMLKAEAFNCLTF